ncbi:MAG: acetoacetate decarboxylase family protein [Pseudomonadota bacterium]
MDYPAPWTLTGDGLILCFRPDDAWLAARPADWSGRLAVVMWVNYRSSPVGPYQEWLFIPGQRRSPDGRQYSISSIFVDSEESMIGGQQNWGIPKRLAEFDWQDDGVSLSLGVSSEDGELQVTGAARGPAIPVPALWQPYRIYQQRDGWHFWTRPTASARCRWFSVVNQQEEGPAVPGLARQKLVAAIEVRDFRMTFPEAQIALIDGDERTI